MKGKPLLIFSSALIAIVIVCSAFGAHVLNPGLEDKYIRTLATANQYFLLMSIGLFALGILNSKHPSFSRSFWLIFTGLICFSGSLYVIVLCKYFGTSIPMIVGPITPIGGVLMIVGWLSVARSITKLDTSSSNDI